MNFHALQTIEARAEAESIMAVKHNIVTPQSHRPVMSLVMDGFLGTSEISHKDTFLNKMELFDWAIETDHTHDIPIPAICHPMPLWTGKQALSMIMPKKLMFRRVKPTIEEKIDDVCIQNGQLLYGYFGKKILGRSQGSLVHVLWLDFGPDACINFLNQLQRGVHRWFSEQGFSIGIGDFIATKETKAKIEEEYQLTLKEASVLKKESEINHRLNSARDGMGRAAAETMGRDNFLYRMVKSGVKGSMMNILQIMAMVGQQNSGGKRIEASIAGKTLPCFKAGDTSPHALGMVRSPYMKGMTPYEFFFSAIVGRDGLINTAINTAVTGYIQRRLVKAMETCKTEWDGSVRDANGAIIQFLYGEDGFDGQPLEFNSTELLEFDKKHFTKLYDWGCEEEMEFLIKAKNIMWKSNVKTISSCFNVRRQLDNILTNDKVKIMPHEAWIILKPYIEWFYEKNQLVAAIVIQTCASKRIATEFKLNKEQFSDLLERLKCKYLKTLIPAGEMTGTLAAQSLGEPVTQMTLDTFHHAGNSAKNVTLGVPRFEELINASSSPKTPSCSIIFNKSGPAEIDKAITLSFEITHLIMRDLVRDAIIEYIDYLEQHPIYCAMPDIPLKKIQFGDKYWCVKLILPCTKMIEHQIEFYTVIRALQTKFHKGINIAYTYDPCGDTIIHVGNYGKKNNKHACTTIRNRIMNCYIRGIPNITLAQPCLDDGILTVETKGSKIYDLYNLKNKYKCIKTVFSNHPFDVLETFGIEAARKTLYDQCHMVLSFDGSYVSCRHYQVMVDRMAWSGNITATTRHGIAKYENKSPIARATFEQPVEVLLDAAQYNKEDPLSGVSEQIVVGIPPKIGTSMISVHQTENYKKLIATQAEEDSDDDDDGWLQFDNSVKSNPFANNNHQKKNIMPPMLQAPVQNTVPMWAQTQLTNNIVSNCFNPHVISAVGNPFGAPPNPFGAPPNPFGAPPNPFGAPPTMAFGAPPTMAFGAPHRPTSPVYNPNRPVSPVYNPNRPVSPVYNPNRPSSPVYNPQGPRTPSPPPYDGNNQTYNPNGTTTPIGSPMSPCYSPMSPCYSPTSPLYDPMDCED